MQEEFDDIMMTSSFRLQPLTFLPKQCLCQVSLHLANITDFTARMGGGGGAKCTPSPSYFKV